MFGELVQLTADAFTADAPRLEGLSPRAAVNAFAVFTRGEVERVLAAGSTMNPEVVRGRLFERARETGRAVRRRLGIVTPVDAFRALRLLYRGIGIDIDADYRTGRITVRRCAFSNAYTPAVCTFIAALDAGFVSGITGGSTLVFSERITEGGRCCRAQVGGERLP